MPLPLHQLSGGTILGPTRVTKPGPPLQPGAATGTLAVIEATVPGFHVTRRSSVPPPHLRQAHSPLEQRGSSLLGSRAPPD